jgi:hypothetical protein
MNSYILDAVRTPRGRGKAGKGAPLGRAPRRSSSRRSCPRSPTRNGFDSRAGRRRRRRRRVAGGRAGIEPRAQRGADLRLAARGERREPEPLLRLGRASGELRGDGRGLAVTRTWWWPVASRACRACRWARTAAASTATTRSCEKLSSGAAGHQRGPHRDARWLHTCRARRRSRSASPRRAREMAQEEARFAQARSSSVKRSGDGARWCSRCDEYPCAGTRPSRPSASSRPRSWSMGRMAAVGPERARRSISSR